MLKTISLENKYVTFLIKIITGFVLLYASAQIVIPLKPVPVTFQTAAIMLIALFYRPSETLISIASYLVAGAIGFSVFQNATGGVDRFFGPTAGYLIGMLVAGYAVSILKESNRCNTEKVSNVVLLMLFGHVIIFAFGISWLSNLIGIKQAFFSGFVVFIPSGIAKILIFSLIFKYINNGIKSYHQN